MTGVHHLLRFGALGAFLLAIEAAGPWIDQLERRIYRRWDEPAP